MAFEELKQRQSVMWGSGPYQKVTETISDIHELVVDRLRGRDRGEIARAFHLGLACGLGDAAVALSGAHGLDTVAASGGVVQNGVLLEDLASLLDSEGIALWINHRVPPNDGGISLGQAALGALGPCTSSP